jgi:hypothetical protein
MIDIEGVICYAYDIFLKEMLVMTPKGVYLVKEGMKYQIVFFPGGLGPVSEGLVWGSKVFTVEDGVFVGET